MEIVKVGFQKEERFFKEFIIIFSYYIWTKTLQILEKYLKYFDNYPTAGHDFDLLRPSAKQTIVPHHKHRHN